MKAGGKLKKKGEIKTEPPSSSDEDVFALTGPRQASKNASAKNNMLLGSGGYLDSQTGDTQFFGPVKNSPTVVSPPRKRSKFKMADSPCPSQAPMKNKGSHSPDGFPMDAKNAIPCDSPAKPYTGFVANEEFGDLMDAGDDELEMKLEEAMMELGRLRQKADAKMTEINVLLSHRLARLRSVFTAARNAGEKKGPVPESPLIQESQTWEAQGPLAEDPYYPSLESQIYHAIVKDYQPLGNVRPHWLK